jgi:hypothetical protein
MKEWNRARRILIVLSLAVAGAGLFALARYALVDGSARGRVAEEQARLMARNEACLQRVEELERVYRKEILPMRNQLIRNRQHFVDAFGSAYPEDRAAASGRGAGERAAGAEKVGGADWAQVRAVLRQVLRDPRAWSRPGPGGAEVGQESFPGPSSSGGNGNVQ